MARSPIHPDAIGSTVALIKAWRDKLAPSLAGETAVADLNVDLPTGDYYTSAAVNRPSASIDGYGYLNVQRYDADYCLQRWTNASNQRTFIRRKLFGVWQPWRQEPAWEEIGRTKTTGAAAISWSGLKAFEMLRLTGKMRSSVTGGLPAIQCGIEGGPIRTGTSDYFGATEYSTATIATAIASAFTNYAGFNGITGATAAEGYDYNFNALFTDFGVPASYTLITLEAGYMITSGGQPQIVQASSHHLTQYQGAEDAFRLVMTNGTIRGSFVLEGIRL